MFRLDQDGEIARLTLDRPEARNAIPLAGWDALAARLDEVADSSARALVITGAGGAFCAGADLKDFPALNRDAALRTRFRTRMRAALDRLPALALPTIARIDGACYGAGVALAMACDIRLASETARFAITPARLGISYPQEDVHRLVALTGPGQAARLLLTATSIDAAEAARIGLVELIGPDEGPLLGAVLANAPESLIALKQGIRLGSRSDVGRDECFDSLIAGDALTARLEALGR